MRIVLPILILISSFFIFHSHVNAVYDPTTLPNNKFGIHILFPEEVFQAKDLVNTNAGDWGYITIPIQSSDRDLDKWQAFMDDCRDLHLIPILRLATGGDYFNTRVWEKPKLEDIIDFANFLNSLEWPIKNRYVIVFNEVNRADEWGGTVSPYEYAEVLNFAIDTFKSKSPDFFIISAGLDNAAPNAAGFMNQYDFLAGVEQSRPGTLAKLDGLASHSYPNPAFSQPPYLATYQNVHSFNFENNLVKNLSGKDLPIFITETNWSSEKLSDNKISEYLTYSLKNVWSKENVIAVTPFLLRAGQGPFTQFSFLTENGGKAQKYEAFEKFPKTAGKPNVEPQKSKKPLRELTLPIRRFIYNLELENELFSSIKPTKTLFKWLLKI